MVLEIAHPIEMERRQAEMRLRGFMALSAQREIELRHRAFGVVFDLLFVGHGRAGPFDSRFSRL